MTDAEAAAALRDWAAHCAERARDTPGREFAEPELTAIRRGWDRVVAMLEHSA